jgi:RNA polymerase sigma-70 factor (ECF subfamily)
MDRESRYREILDSNKDRIFRLCCGYVGDRDERNDVYQEVLINIWKSLETFRDQAQMSTWVYRIAVNTCLSHLRTEKRRRGRIDNEASARIEMMPQEEQDENEDELHRSIERLYRCIATLCPVDRALVALYMEDVGSRESAEILGISEGNVRVKLHRIRKVLKSKLEENGHGT